jgi:hypothetical protein
VKVEPHDIDIVVDNKIFEKAYSLLKSLGFGEPHEEKYLDGTIQKASGVV